MKKSTRFLYLLWGILVALFSGGILLLAVLKQNMWFAVGEATILFVFSIFLAPFSHKYAQSYLDLPVEVRQKRFRLVELNQKYMKLVIVIFPVLFFLLPLIFSLSPEEPAFEYFLHDGFMPLMIFLLLLYGDIWFVFFRYRWVIKYVKNSGLL